VAGSFTGPAGLCPSLIVDVQINQLGESR